jgi:hypothetical protein
MKGTRRQVLEQITQIERILQVTILVRVHSDDRDFDDAQTLCYRMISNIW